MGAARQNPLILFTAHGRRGRELFDQLVRAGFNVKQVSTENLFDVFLEDSPDLVLVEFSRSAKGIEDLAHRIRATEHGIAVPIYFYGEGEGPNPVEVVSLGGDLYFTVPVEDGFLFAKLGFMEGGGSRATAHSISESHKEKQGEGTEEDPVRRALEMAEQLSDHGWRPAKKSGAEMEAAQPKSSVAVLRKEDMASEKSDTDEMDLLDELEVNTPGILGEPGVGNGVDGGVVPSLKAMLPNDEFAGEHDEFDLDLLDLDSTMPGMADGNLGELADPSAGLAGLDMPDIDLSDTGRSEHDTDSWTDGGIDAESGSSDGDAKEWLGDEVADRDEKSGFEGSAGISVDDDIAYSSGEVTQDPGPLERNPDGKVVGGNLRPGVSTQVLEDEGVGDEQNTVVGHKKRDDVEGVDLAKDLVLGADRTDRPQDVESRKSVIREEGSFVKDPLEIVARLFRLDATGRLQMTCERGEVNLYLVSGRPVALYAAGSEIDLPAGLEQRARISRGQLDRIRREMDERNVEGEEVLVKMGYVQAMEMPFLVRVHMESLFYEVMGWQKGEYVFEPDVMDKAEPVLERTFAALLLEALRRKGKGEDAFARLGGVRARLVGWKNSAAFVETSELTNAEKRVVEKLSAGMDLAEAAEASEVNIYEAAVPAYAAVLLGDAKKQGPGEKTGRQVEEPQVSSPVFLEAHEERITSKLEDIETGDYFTILGISRRSVPYEVKSSHKAMTRNFSKEVIPKELMEKRREDLETIIKALDEAAAVLTHPRYGPLYRRAMEINVDETD